MEFPNTFRINMSIYVRVNPSLPNNPTLLNALDHVSVNISPSCGLPIISFLIEVTAGGTQDEE